MTLRESGFFPNGKRQLGWFSAIIKCLSRQATLLLSYAARLNIARIPIGLLNKFKRRTKSAHSTDSDSSARHKGRGKVKVAICYNAIFSVFFFFPNWS